MAHNAQTGNAGHGRPANRLAGETSPYLLQHAHNPVDWYPWGAEAFAAARTRDVPIFLSVGYSTCYWCHVMERESFEDETTGTLMSERFVCIKLDREERPDVDDVYMNAVQLLTGRGGWPMSVFLEPTGLRPFWAGTYFPVKPAHGLPSFTQVLEGMSGAWRERRAEVMEQAEQIGKAVAERVGAAQEPVKVGEKEVAGAISTLLRIYDRVQGGFGGAPKFPQPVYLDLLLQFRPHAADAETLGAVDLAVRHTLDRMAIGGMSDQVGGGFHRYSVDAEWLVPHFEKMLYDNAQLAETYARAARAYGDEFYARTARRTLDYVLREMTSPEGGFFSAQDAEVGGHEGLNYLWTGEQMREVLTGDDLAFALDIYGIDDGPNFRDPHHPEDTPANVLRLRARPDALATQGGRGVSREAFLTQLDRVNAVLYAARAQREQPRLDDKVLAGWNGLMIGAMAVGGAATGEAKYVKAAARAADFVLGTMREHAGTGAGKEKERGGLLRTYRAGRAKIPAFLEDYAFMAHGLIELHRAGDDAGGKYLDAAAALTEEAVRRFGDGQVGEGAGTGGGFYDTLAGQTDLFIRTRSAHDGAIPSGSSVMLNNLLDLHEILNRREDLERAVGCLLSVSAAIAESPVSAANATRGLLRIITADRETVAPLLAALEAAPAPTEDEQGEGTPEPVEVYASVDELTVSEGSPAELMLRIIIADGYHINAADPGPGGGGGGGLIPLRVGVVGGAGLAAFADYPPGEPYGQAGEIRIHRGTIELRVAVERAGPWTGRPLLSVTYQACTETECLRPVTVELDVRVDRE